MSLSRRFLPSTAALASFEAAARLGSISGAARELALTQSAVSRQIKALETQLGVDLFVREKQSIRLSGAGEAYLAEITEALRIIGTASLNVRANPGGGTLNLAILPTFGTRWLAPRLPDFIRANPGVAINLTTRLRPFDFSTDRQHAAIHFGALDWPGTQGLFLQAETIGPVCSQEFLDQHHIEEPSDLLDVPLLHISTRPDAWARWFNANGVRVENAPGMIFDQFATVAGAAISGLGAALLPLFLIQGELESGDLVQALDAPYESEGGYYLVWPRDRQDYPPLTAFRNWLTEEIGKDTL